MEYQVTREMGSFDVETRTKYPIGGWHVDLVVGSSERSFGVETEVHPEGPDAHIDRHLAMKRAGWEIADAFESRWLANPEGAAEMLARKYLSKP